MARPIKNNADYFSHDAGMRNHRKVKAIRSKFGIQGYAIWVMLLEYLTASDGNVFPYTDLEFELISGDFGVSATEIREVVDYCISLELLFNKNGFINSDTLDERLAPVYEKRRVAKELSKQQQRYNGKFTNNNTDPSGESVTEMPQSKVNESKGKETIEYDLQSNPLGLYILVTDGTRQKLKIHQQSFEKYMQGTFGAAWEGQTITIKSPPPIEQFFKQRNGELFNSNQHVWQSFKKLWLNPPASTTRPKSKIH